MKALLILTVCVALAGCATTGGGSSWTLWNPSTWFAGKDLRDREKRVNKLKQTEEVALKQSQVLVTEAKLLLEKAPPSRPVHLAKENLELATTSMDRAIGPLPSLEIEELKKQVTKLLSENADLQAAAERDRVERNAEVMKTTDLISRLTNELEASNSRVAAEAYTNLLLANKHRNLVFGIWIFVGLWVFVAFIMPILGRAFPAFGAAAAGAQAIFTPFAVAAGNRAKAVLTDVVKGVHEVRHKLKKDGIIDKEGTDEILKQWVTEDDGMAAYVDSIRRKEGLLKDAIT